jgi:hypothetical protein
MGAIAIFSFGIYKARASLITSYRESQNRTPGMITTGFCGTAFMIGSDW